MSIGHPGSTSDYLAFVASALCTKAETPGFLAPGLVLHGDNAYVSNNRIVTPYEKAKSGNKDACNFYQSQLCTRIECAFSMLVRLWAILRKPVPPNMPLGKVAALTYCLCELRNYCINENESKYYEQTKIDSFFLQ